MYCVCVQHEFLMLAEAVAGTAKNGVELQACFVIFDSSWHLVYNPLPVTRRLRWPSAASRLRRTLADTSARSCGRAWPPRARQPWLSWRSENPNARSQRPIVKRHDVAVDRCTAPWAVGIACYCPSDMLNLTSLTCRPFPFQLMLDFTLDAESNATV